MTRAPDNIATANNGSHENSRHVAGKHCADFLDSLGIEE